MLRLSVNLDQEKGFTLIEVMIVLCVVGLFIIITSSVYSSAKEMSTSFETQLTNDLHFAQLVALKEKQYVTVRFDASKQNYKMIAGYTPNEKVLADVMLPENVELLENGTLSVFRYAPSGNTTTFGVVRFKVNGASMNYHFYLAKGRFYVEKS
ncbi:competence type IV pilus minor pilin ComGD [Jeotgalibacillus salarius]|nr:competence type IV pilus minor pilin ComGD [Jeotgalibacillus salarius]